LPEDGASIDSSDKSLTGCKGKASSAIPADGVYVITTFGGPSESQQMSCGSHTQNGSWYYAASRQRYGCGSKIQITGGGNCVVAQTDDYGPDVCVENAAGRAIIDVSPMVSQALFGTNGMGWSDNVTVTVTQVPNSTQLGPCTATNPANDPGTGTGGTGNDPGTGTGGSGSADPGTGGTGGGGQCYCDSSCEEYGDCCTPGCGNSGSGGSPGSGGTPGSGGGGGQCYCDASCEEYGDCCTPGCGNSGSGGSGTGGGSSGYCGDGYCDISGGEDCSTCIEDCDPYGGCY
jgi:hypothetical protein